MTLRLSDAETMRFVQLYENERVLYDPCSVDYRSRDARTAAARRISEKLDVPDFGPKEVIIKFKNLRSSYCQELKKIAASGQSETSPNHVAYKPKVIWFDKMDAFIRPFVQQKEIPSQDPLMRFETLKTEPLPLEEELIYEDLLIPSALMPIVSTKRKQNLTQQTPQCSSSRNQKTPQWRINRSYSGTTTEKSADTKTRCELVGSNGGDCYEHFGRYVASMLRTIGPPEAMRLQQQITVMITDQIMCEPPV